MPFQRVCHEHQAYNTARGKRTPLNKTLDDTVSSKNMPRLRLVSPGRHARGLSTTCAHAGAAGGLLLFAGLAPRADGHARRGGRARMPRDRSKVSHRGRRAEPHVGPGE